MVLNSRFINDFKKDPDNFTFSVVAVGGQIQEDSGGFQ